MPNLLCLYYIQRDAYNSDFSTGEMRILLKVGLVQDWEHSQNLALGWKNLLRGQKHLGLMQQLTVISQIGLSMGFLP